MIRALLWKEWREIWQVLPVGILWAVGLVVSAHVLEVRGSVSVAENRTHAFVHGRPAVRAEDLSAARFRWSCMGYMVGISAAMALGVAALVGAGAFAQEREGKTEIYLESLAASRQQLWSGKLLARMLAILFAFACTAGPVLSFSMEAVVSWELFRAPGLYGVAFSALGLSFLTSTLLTDSLGALAAGLVLWLTPHIMLVLTFPKKDWLGPPTIIGNFVLGVCALALSFVIFVHRPFQRWSRGLGTRQEG